MNGSVIEPTVQGVHSKGNVLVIKLNYFTEVIIMGDGFPTLEHKTLLYCQLQFLLTRSHMQEYRQPF